MNDNPRSLIEVEAVKALIDWKSLFAEEVVAHARRIAAESSQPARVTLRHYQQAAHVAIQSLSAAIQGTGTTGNGQKAA